jgi:hypothetical protein
MIIKEIIIYLIRALNPVAFRRDRANQSQMLRQIVKYLRIALNPVAFERERVTQIRAKDKQIQVKDRQIQAKDKQIEARNKQIQVKDKRIELLRDKVEALRKEGTRLPARVRDGNEMIEALSCLGSSGPERQVIYHRLLATLSNDGYGYDFAFTDEQRRYPMAYALIASAEAHRYLMTKDEGALTGAMRNADWLVANSDLNNDGLPGWGLPFAWDAFQDGPPNPAHTQYAITTALCAKGLLDTYDAVESCPGASENHNINLQKARYLETADASMHSFVRSNAYNRYADSRIAFWYSLRPEDSYDAINIQAMCAGILQRLSTYPIGSSRATVYAELAGQVASYVMDHKQECAGGWVWNYLGRHVPPVYSHRLNDTVHATYIVDGLMTFKLYGGRAGHDIDGAKLLAGLALFIVDGKVLHMPGRDIPPRLWGVGYLLYVVNHHFDAPALADIVYAYAITDLWVDARFQFREDDDSDYVRDQTHMLLGLSDHAYKSQQIPRECVRD